MLLRCVQPFQIVVVAFLTVAGGRGAAFNRGGVSAIALDPDGHLLIADTANHRLRKVDRYIGSSTVIAGNGEQGSSDNSGPAAEAAMGEPQSITVTPADRIYVVHKDDDSNSIVRMIDSVGIITTVAGGGGTPPVEGVAAADADLHIFGIAADPKGNVYVIEPGVTWAFRGD